MIVPTFENSLVVGCMNHPPEPLRTNSIGTSSHIFEEGESCSRSAWKPFMIDIKPFDWWGRRSQGLAEVHQKRRPRQPVGVVISDEEFQAQQLHT